MRTQTAFTEFLPMLHCSGRRLELRTADQCQSISTNDPIYIIYLFRHPGYRGKLLTSSLGSRSVWPLVDIAIEFLVRTLHQQALN